MVYKLVQQSLQKKLFEEYLLYVTNISHQYQLHSVSLKYEQEQDDKQSHKHLTK